MSHHTHANAYKPAPAILLLCLASLATHADEFVCKKPEPGNSYGPFDYRNPASRAKDLPLVESYHFGPNVATLKSSQASPATPPNGDLDYTLRSFPNHHRALQSLADLALREKKTKLPQMTYSVPCFFIRAGMFAPDDGMVNAVYAYYLANFGQKELAASEARHAMEKDPNNPQVAYKVGLAYYYMGDYKTAREYSAKAQSLGSTAVGLDKLLSQAGSPPPPREDGHR